MTIRNSLLLVLEPDFDDDRMADFDAMVEHCSGEFAILDARAIAADFPYTFLRPNDAELAAMGQGDIVKLMTNQAPDDEDGWLEWAWVCIDSVNGDELTGRLDYFPVEVSRAYYDGDPIIFDRDSVVAIHWADPATAPEGSPQSGYWEKCIVDVSVADGTERVECLYREEPQILTGTHQGSVDSGWRILGKTGIALHRQSIERVQAGAAVRWVLDQDDSWIHLIDAPVGSEFIRDIETGTWSQVQ